MTFLANATRLLLACGAYVLHHALRTHPLAHTALATAQPSTVILTLVTGATQVKQYKDWILLHLPTSCPVKALLHRVTTLRTAIPVPALPTSSGLRYPQPLAAVPPLDCTIRRGNSVWHRPRALQKRGAPGGRRIAGRTGPTETLQQGRSRKKPSPSVYPDARLPLKWATWRFMKYPG